MLYLGGNSIMPDRGEQNGEFLFNNDLYIGKPLKNNGPRTDFIP